MHLDVLDLRNFYYRTGLGRAAQKSVRGCLQQLWPDAEGQTVLGFGFAVPLLRPYLGAARRVTALMPAQQGVMPWPAGLENISVLSEEVQWPVQTGSVDRLILLHGLEASEHPSALLDECARVLGDGGRIMVIVPNRSGLWARRDRTPFGFGRPYSLTQLEGQLRRHGFTPERHLAALFQPPSPQRFWLRTARIWEGLGRRMPWGLAGGVLLVEASKQVYSPVRPGLPELASRPVKALEGLAPPSPEPALGRESRQ
ncbi:MAG: methyltransferase domain-containing protein [Pseudomonadota bacterium]